MRRVFPVLVLAAVLASCQSVSPSVLADEYYNLGNEWFDLKKYDRAAAAYQKALRWNSELRIATVNWARSKAELGDVAGALEILAPVAQQDPDNLVVLQYRAWLTAKKDGAAAAADQYLRLAQKLPGDAATQYNAGVSLRAAKRDAEALTAFQAWKGLDGKTWSGLSALAALLDQTGSAEAAEAWFAAADSLPASDAKRFLPLTRWATALEKAERYGDAAQAWREALALPSSPDQARGEAQFRLGSLLLLSIEDYTEGSKALIEAWKAGYKDKDAWKTLRENPDLKFTVRLEADLKLAGVEP